MRAENSRNFPLSFATNAPDASAVEKSMTFNIKVGNIFFFAVVFDAFLAKLYCRLITVLIGDVSFCPKNRYSIHHRERSCQMFFILAVVVVLLLLVLAGADLFVAQYNSDELSNMGVQER
jgi:hypothetical protein